MYPYIHSFNLPKTFIVVSFPGISATVGVAVPQSRPFKWVPSVLLGGINNSDINIEDPILELTQDDVSLMS
eukprot:12642132-Ditylum_brightwellii.AAC.1